MAIVKGTDNSNIIDFVDGVTNGDDVISALGGNDTVFAFGGNDRIIGGLGADHLNGGAGIDTAEYGDSEQGVIVNLMTGMGIGGTAQGDTLLNIENIFGSNFDDLLIGNNSANELRGADNDDTLKGGGGADLLSGGFGDDTASYYDSTEGVFINLMPTIALGGGGDAEGDTLLSIEHVTGSDHADTLWGNGLDNILRGRGGDDMLKGMGGADILDGGDGRDIMEGGAGDDTYYVDDYRGDQAIEAAGQGVDTVYAYRDYVLTEGSDLEWLIALGDRPRIFLTGNEAGNVIQGNNQTNVINGGDGNDQLIGLGGEDSFVFSTAPNADTNVDEIADFDVREDRIVLDSTIFSSLDQQVTIGVFIYGTEAQDADDHLIYDHRSGALFYDSDGNGGAAAVRFAQLAPGLWLTYTDFLVEWVMPAG